ncbi:hypothetical protein HDU97_005481 [Phlyctochytrium planicorne]|nr:hypothetical protein HDU97_005481 [Phlyctochytrium planicorne]
MAATIQIQHASFIRHRRLPSDPLNESIYNLVTRPEDDRPPPLFKSRFSQHVRQEHFNSRRSGKGGNDGNFAPLSSSSWSPASVMERERPGTDGAGGGLAGIGKAIAKKRDSKIGVPSKQSVLDHPRVVPKTSTGLYVSSQKPSSLRTDKRKSDYSSSSTTVTKSRTKIAQKRQQLQKAHRPPKQHSDVIQTNRPISKPTSGRIAMAAEKRSNASTPVVADPLRWDNVAADEAEAEILQKFKDGLHISPEATYQQTHEDEVPEELESTADAEEELEKALPMSNLVLPAREMESTTLHSLSFQNKRKLRPHVAPGNSPTLHPNGARIPTVTTSGQNNGARRMLPEAERLAILAGLKANHGAILEMYQRMSVSVDTVSKMNR